MKKVWKKVVPLLLSVLLISSSFSVVTVGATGIDLINEIKDSGAPVQPDDKELIDTNILLGKIPTDTNGSSMAVVGGGGGAGQETNIQYPAAATDGSTANDQPPYTEIRAGVETGGSDNGYSKWNDSYLQYDFGKLYDLKAINIYRYNDGKSTYNDIKVELSNDPTFAISNKVFGPQSITTQEDAAEIPQVITLGEPVKAQYLRVYGKGYIWHNGSNRGYSSAVRFSEIEAIAAVPKADLPPDPPTIDSVNIAPLKLPFADGKGLENAKNINDGNLNTYAEHQSIGCRNIQFNYRNPYAVSKIEFKLEQNVTYVSVKVDISTSPTGGFKNVFIANNYTQDTQLKTIELPICKNASHVRITVDGGNSKVKYCEVNIWGAGNSYDESPSDYNGIRNNTQYTNLTWNDEFNNDTVDETKWNIIDGMKNYASVYNKKAVSIEKDGENHYLAINSKNFGSYDALKDDKREVEVYSGQNTNGVTWSSGRVESKNKFSFQYGRVAVRAKVNGSKGLWPAIWALAQDEKGHDEIDILEYPQYNDAQAYQAWTTNHFGKYGYDKDSQGWQNQGYEAWSENFHVYEVEWNKDSIEFFIDGVSVGKTTAGKDQRDGMHTRPMFLILETQVGGGGWAGNVDSNLTKQDSNYLVDWVRVYQKQDADPILFDDLASLDSSKTNNPYLITPYQTSGAENFELLTNGDTQATDKNNFFYGGQPRYEDSRVSLKEDKSRQNLIYHVGNLKDVHLSTYYQTIEGKGGIAPSTRDKVGYSIRSTLQNNKKLDFNLYTSITGKDGTWKKINKVQIYENLIEPYPGYARYTYDAYSLPFNTNYLKIEFPDYEGKTYLNAQNKATAVINTDVQLAKVVLLQNGAAKPIDSNQLKELINGTLDEIRYTTETWNNYLTMRDAAQAIADKTSATNDEFKTAYTNLQFAIDNLKTSNIMFG